MAGCVGGKSFANSGGAGGGELLRLLLQSARGILDDCCGYQAKFVKKKTIVIKRVLHSVGLG